MDVNVSLASRGLYRAVLPPEEGVAPLEDQHVYTALYLDGVALDIGEISNGILYYIRVC